MRHDKLQHQLDLLLLLTENHQYTVEDLCDKLEISRRNLYYYLGFFRESMLGLRKQGKYFFIPRSSEFIRKVTEIVDITEDEAVMLKRLLEDSNQNISQIRTLKDKLQRFYDFHIMDQSKLKRKNADIVAKIYQAIREERTIRIIDYVSSNSQTISDRIVEPFLLMNGSSDLRAYELASATNKTFRIARMADVEILPDEWQHKDQHREIYTDVFNFTSEKKTKVTLMLDVVARNILTDEYPSVEDSLTHDLEQQGWFFTTEVCSMLGIGRFVLGLYDHIKIIDSPELQTYINEKLSLYNTL